MRTFNVSGIANKIGLIEVQTSSLNKAIRLHKKSKNWATFTISTEDDVVLYYEELGEIKVNRIAEYEKQYNENLKDFKKYCSKKESMFFSDELAKIHVLCM